MAVPGRISEPAMEVGVSSQAFLRELKGCGEIKASGLPTVGQDLGRHVRVRSSAPFAPGGSVQPESLPALE